MKPLLFLLAFLAAAPVFADEPKILYWEDLLPANEDEFLEELLRKQEEEMGTIDHGFGAGGAGFQLKSFNVVKELDGQRVRIPGFVVPLEFTRTGELSEFLLVPYQGACIHLPPPPPNQLVYAYANEAQVFGDMWSPIWLTGVIRTQQFLNDMGDAAYTLEIQSWEPYQGRE